MPVVETGTTAWQAAVIAVSQHLQIFSREDSNSHKQLKLQTGPKPVELPLFYSRMYCRWQNRTALMFCLWDRWATTSAPSGGVLKLAGCAPAIYGLEVRCIIYCATASERLERWDLNSHPPLRLLYWAAYKTVPIRSKVELDLEGFEPSAFRMQIWHASQLRHKPKKAALFIQEAYHLATA